MTVKPAKNQIFCKALEQDNKTKSGLYIPGKDSVDPSVAVVIDVGEGVPYKKDAKIVYKSYASQDVRLDEVDYMIVSLEDVLGEVVENTDNK